MSLHPVIVGGGPAGLMASVRNVDSWMMCAKASAGSTRQPFIGVHRGLG